MSATQGEPNPSQIRNPRGAQLRKKNATQGELNPSQIRNPRGAHYRRTDRMGRSPTLPLRTVAPALCREALRARSAVLRKLPPR